MLRAFFVFMPPLMSCPLSLRNCLTVIMYDIYIYLDPPRGAKWMVKGAIKQPLRVQTPHISPSISIDRQGGDFLDDSRCVNACPDGKYTDHLASRMARWKCTEMGGVCSCWGGEVVWLWGQWCLKKVQLVISNWKIFVGGLKQSKHMFTFLIPNTSKTKGEMGVRYYVFFFWL